MDLRSKTSLVENYYITNLKVISNQFIDENSKLNKPRFGHHDNTVSIRSKPSLNIFIFKDKMAFLK